MIAKGSKGCTGELCYFNRHTSFFASMHKTNGKHLL